MNPKRDLDETILVKDNTSEYVQLFMIQSLVIKRENDAVLRGDTFRWICDSQTPAFNA